MNAEPASVDVFAGSDCGFVSVASATGVGWSFSFNFLFIVIVVNCRFSIGVVCRTGLDIGCLEVRVAGGYEPKAFRVALRILAHEQKIVILSVRTGPAASRKPRAKAPRT